MVDTELKQKWILAQQAFLNYHLWMSSRDYVLHATDCVTVSVPLQHLMLSCAWNVIMARYRRNFLSEWTDIWLLACHIIVTSTLLVLCLMINHYLMLLYLSISVTKVDRSLLCWDAWSKNNDLKTMDQLQRIGSRKLENFFASHKWIWNVERD